MSFAPRALWCVQMEDGKEVRKEKSGTLNLVDLAGSEEFDAKAEKMTQDEAKVCSPPRT